MPRRAQRLSSDAAVMSVRARASSGARVRGGPGRHAVQAAQGHGCEVSAGCRSLCLVRSHPPWLRTPESAVTAQDDVLASQEQNRWAVRSHWCFGTRTPEPPLRAVHRLYVRVRRVRHRDGCCARGDTNLKTAPRHGRPRGALVPAPQHEFPLINLGRHRGPCASPVRT